MKTHYLLLPIASLLLLGCEPLNEGHGTARKASMSNRIEEEDSTATETPVAESDLYITGVEQTQDGKYIILFRNGERIMSIRTGDLEEIGGENDQHHFLNGHIITEYNSSSGTVIKKDGKDFVRYDGCEVLRGLLSQEGSIYTLGQNRRGEGFSLRADGEVIFESESGRVWGDMLDITSYPSGALYEDNGSVIFCYYKSNDSQDSQNGVRQWFIVRDGFQTQLMIPNNITEIYDIRIIDGHICMVGCQGYSTYPVLLIDGEISNLSNPATATMKDFRLVKGNGRLTFYGTVIAAGDIYKTGIWGKEGLMYSYEGKNDIILESHGFYSYICYHDGTINICSPFSESGILYGPFHFITCWNLASDGSTIHLIANPVDKSQNPILWSDGVITEFDQNIFLTSICIVNREV